MDSPIRAAQSTYYGDSFFRTPPPDLESLLLQERIVYLGMPLAPAVAELIIAELLYLQSEDPEKPIKLYINSMGEVPGNETSAFAICDTMKYIKPPIHTFCIGFAVGMAALLLSAGTKGCRASLPHARIVLRQPLGGARGQATDIQIQANEVIATRAAIIDIFSQNTGQSSEAIKKDMDRINYMSPEEAVTYGLIDRVLESTKDLPKVLPAGVS